MALVVTVAFTPFYRVATLVFVTAFFAYCGDLLAEIPFFTGALLADMSLLIKDDTFPLLPLSLDTRSPTIRKYWPIAVGLFGLVIGSYPPNSPELSQWSIFLTKVGYTFFHPHCTAPHPHL